MNYWLLLCSPDKWFGDKSFDNVKVNNMLLTLDEQRWGVQEKYFRDVKIGDKCILKVGEDKRSSKRRKLENGDLVDILESGIYAIGTIIKELYLEDEAYRIKFKCEYNFFLKNKIIKREDAEKILGNDYLSMSSKRISEIKYQEVLDLIDSINEGSDLNPTKESDVRVYPAQVKVERANFSIYELKRQYEDRKKLIIDPNFQRENVWKTNKQKSELIESILMGIPLPLIYFSQNSEGKLQVVDGRQRLTTLFDFMNDKFALSELNILKELKGKKFSELNSDEQSELEDYQLIAYVIKPPTPDRIKFDIFDRVNRGGTRLNNQEMRNALYQGKVTELLSRLNQNENFKKATDKAISNTRMKDKYIILRFISFYLLEEGKLLDKNNKLISYKSDIDEFLGNAMAIVNEFNDKEIKEIENIFNISMKNSYKILGKNAFRMPSDSNRKRPISMALFESLGYLMSFDSIVNRDVKVIKKKVLQLLETKKFNKIVTYKIDSSVNVTDRFDGMKKILEELKNDK
jgi:hypothetical protein